VVFLALLSADGAVLNDSAIVVAIVSVVGTLGAAWLMFRGKTQDTANWLIVELRNQAKAAMESAISCESQRVQDRVAIDELRSTLAGLQGGMRKLTKENAVLHERVQELESFHSK
jgi:hypothetical protein